VAERPAPDAPLPRALDEALDGFLGHLRVERGLSRNTIESYQRDLRDFASFAQRQGLTTPQEFDLGTISAWLSSLSRRGLSARSSARHLSALRGFMKFLIREDTLGTDPSQHAARIRLGRRLPKPLSIDHVVRLLRAPDPSTPRGVRDRAMLSLLYASGLRVSELTRLRVSELDLQRGVVAPIGKGSKQRLVPMGELALEHLEAHLSQRDSSCEWVFPNKRRKPFTRQMVWKMIGRYAVGAGIPEHVHPHRLRHSFATHLLAGGADLRSVQSMLVYANVVTTEIYTKVSSDTVQRAFRASHPRAKL